MTNADKIREMTDEELAKLLDYGFNAYFAGAICKPRCAPEKQCHECIYEWLKSEVKLDD